MKVTDYNWLVYNNRGVTYDGLGNYRQAIEDANMAIEIKPGFAEAYYIKGIMYSKSGNKNMAVNDLKTAAKLGDKRAKIFLKSQGISW